MENIKTELTKLNKNKNLEATLKKEYILASKDEEFTKLIKKLKVKDDIAYKYTSKLQNTVIELNNCKKCRSLTSCENPVTGFVDYPKLVNDRLEFNYMACKYKKEEDKKENKNVTYFEIPYLIKQARMKDIDITDKNRTEVIKWLKKFYDTYPDNQKQKGLYLHGSFGSGKSFLVASLLNELALKDYKVVIVYFPDFLLSLKNFEDDFNERIEEVKTCDLLLLDDMGAQANTAWGRDEILGSILQSRMDNQLPTFFTSNYTLEELEAKLAISKGQEEKVAARRIIERIKQLTENLSLISENRRK